MVRRYERGVVCAQRGGAESECLTRGCAHSCGQRGTALQTLGTVGCAHLGQGFIGREATMRCGASMINKQHQSGRH